MPLLGAAPRGGEEGLDLLVSPGVCGAAARGPLGVAALRLWESSRAVAREENMREPPPFSILAFFGVTLSKTKSGHETGPQGTDSSLDP